MTFCPSCGTERKEGSKYCHNCGYDFGNVSAELNSNSNSNTQATQNPIPNVQSENSHTISKILGYICAILIPLFGVIFGIYLITRDEEDAKKHGKLIIGLSIVIWFLSFIAMGM
ncbi:zinc-ribbon domain-containing protein [Methanobrevibacter sp.]|uniref:zinc-ribbon domain-containing protein n=1 Tax=Methanobrevibacter sp. TaxID=66852 RepID=UPI0025F569A2|nr:zinc-ribbon domain-containing protein [uncultured Methanobrevibacter sp.]